MSGRIIRLHGDPHEEAQRLLPWYETRTLEPVEQAQVEAHLGDCAECRADLAAERRLEAEFTALPVEAAQGWARLQGRLEREASRRRTWMGVPFGDAWRPAGGGVAVGRTWFGWALAAQAALLAAAIAVILPAQRPAAAYHALGAAQAPAPSGNVVVIFRPDTPERALRGALQANHAQLVDGPTAADAYVLHVAPAVRAAALAGLRSRPEVVLAEPVDPPESR
jgi:hypothetical protein